MRKANQIILVAKKLADNGTRGPNPEDDNPYKKPWSLQADGDLWQIAWGTVKKRGRCDQKVRKVKGHAVEADITGGICTRADKEGNDRSDKNVDVGVTMIRGIGLKKLGNWLATRHDNYKAFMFRVHRMIVAVTAADRDPVRPIPVLRCLSSKKTDRGLDVVHHRRKARLA